MAVLQKLRRLPLQVRFGFNRAARLVSTQGLETLEAVEADLSRLLVLGAVSATALSTGAFFLRKDGSVAEGRIYPQDWRYLCEGQHFLLCGPKESTDWSHWGGYVLQLRKGPRGTSTLQEMDIMRSLEWQVGIQRLLSKVAFQPLVLSVPEMVLVPGADVRALDAQLLSARPQELRKQRLDVQEVTGQIAKVRLLRKENLLDAWAPSLSLELLPGCGLQEVEGMPSRHSMAFEVAHGKADRDWNLALFSKEATICRDAVLRSISEPSRGCEIFAKGRHVGQDAREELLQELGLSLEEFAEAAAAVLSGPDSVLEPLRKLQAFAAGNTERLAGQILSELQKHGSEAAAELLQPQQLQAALQKAPRPALGKSGLTGMQCKSASELCCDWVEAAKRHSAWIWISLPSMRCQSVTGFVVDALSFWLWTSEVMNQTQMLVKKPILAKAQSVSVVVLVGGAGGGGGAPF
ncbi:unnamed protein product [Symbiodinium sp. KB8]|nr:unnamed protein product [Symbiodinium sp. KB8]